MSEPSELNGNLPAELPVQESFRHSVEGAKKYEILSIYFGIGSVVSIVVSLIVGLYFVWLIFLAPVLSIFAIVFAWRGRAEGSDSFSGMMMGWITFILSMFPVISLLFILFLLGLAGR